MGKQKQKEGVEYVMVRDWDGKVSQHMVKMPVPAHKSAKDALKWITDNINKKTWIKDEMNNHSWVLGGKEAVNEKDAPKVANQFCLLGWAEKANQGFEKAINKAVKRAIQDEEGFCVGCNEKASECSCKPEIVKFGDIAEFNDDHRTELEDVKRVLERAKKYLEEPKKKGNKVVTKVTKKKSKKVAKKAAKKKSKK